MFSHPSVEEVSRLLDGELARGRQTAVLSHMEICSQCQYRRDAYSQVKMGLSRLPMIDGKWVDLSRVMPTVLGRSGFLPRGFVVGILVGLGVTGVGLLVRPVPGPLKVVSSVGFGEVRGMEGERRIASGEAVQAWGGGGVDLEIPGEVLLRMEPGSTMTWQQKGGGIFGKPEVIVDLLRGGFVARTREGFWGNRLEIRTPTAMTLVRGTAFSVDVDPREDATNVKVLAGKVFISPYLKEVGVQVSAGEGSRIRGGRLPEAPVRLSVEEMEKLMEAYRIGGDPDVAVVVGIGPGRVEELFKGAPLYVSKRVESGVHPLVRERVRQLNEALWGGKELDLRAVKILEMAVGYAKDPAVAVPLRLYAGSVAIRRGDLPGARLHFEQVVEGYPDHPQASLALGAMGVLAERQKDTEKAKGLFKQVLSDYPKSPEAVVAKEFIRKNGHSPKWAL